MSNLPSLVVTRQYPPESMENLKKHFSIVFYNDSPEVVASATFEEALKSTEYAFITLSDRVSSTLLDQCHNLKAIATLSVGLDHIDVVHCRSRGISVYNTPDVLTETTAELTLALIFAACRQIPQGAAAVREGLWTTWKPFWLCGKDIHGSIVGVYGLGAIGLAVAKKAHALGASIVWYNGDNRSETELTKQATGLGFKQVSATEIFSLPDILTLHCPLVPTTHQIVNKTSLGLMKKDAVLINTARGPCVNQDDLYDALHNNRLGAAALDVTVPEPLPTDHPLLRLPNCLIVPHIGSASWRTRTNMANLCIENLISHIADPTQKKSSRVC